MTSTSDPRFVAFWSAYPRKVKKAETLRKFDIAVRKGADPELIARAAAAYARQRAEEDPQFTLHPSTWLHGGCWEDEGLLAPADPRERRDGESFEQFKARMAELRQASGQ